MLVYFRAENFRSIKEPIELDLRAAPRLRRLKGHVRTPAKDKSLKVLKSAVLYGANASGKSNILKAIHFAQQMITGHLVPNTPISSEPFSLTVNVKEESSFYFEFALFDMCWCYGIRFNNERILEENLTVLSEARDFCVFSREYSDSEEYKINLEYVDLVASKEERTEFEFLIKYTPKNRLFISECAERGGFEKLVKTGSYLYTAHSFFKSSLVVIFPETSFEGRFQDAPLITEKSKHFTELLSSFDTGVETFSRVKVDAAIFPSTVFDTVRQKIGDNMQSFASFNYQNQEYIVGPDDNGKLSFYKIYAVHKLPSGETIDLELNKESDGTLRLLDLLPTITQQAVADMSFTFLIDEFDRSLHPNLAKAFLNLFLNSELSDNDNQLIATTHEAELLDNDLLRRDEIWFVQKEWDSASRLYCLNDYSTRFDKDIHKAYLSGKFGAVPILMDEFKK